MRRFVVIGQRATASPEFLLNDLPGTSGRLDVLLRCVRAALLLSHGVRRDTTVYLVLLGGPAAPRVVRIDGAAARYVRPDERSLATTLKKALSAEASGEKFSVVRPGIAVADGALDVVLRDAGMATPLLLEEGAPDVRSAEFEVQQPLIFIGDHLGFDPNIRARLQEIGALPISVGPLSLHAEDAISVVNNELDRRALESLLHGEFRPM